MKKFLIRELQMRLDDHRSNNPRMKPTTTLVRLPTITQGESRVTFVNVNLDGAT